MLITRDDKYDTHTFNVINDVASSQYIYIKSIGHELRYPNDEKSYYWDCRSNEKANIDNTACIFQYTVSGCGIVEINRKQHKLTAGSIFMIERPGPYRYWLPEDYDHWELKFLELSTNSMPQWTSITKSFGHVFEMNQSKTVMDIWTTVFESAKKQTVCSFFDNTKLAYIFLIELHRYLTDYGAKSKNTEAIELCLNFIRDEFRNSITLSDIANAGELSPFYLNKIFKNVVGDTPMNYVSKLRVRHSMALLYNSLLSVDEIAKQCGFQNSNYFSKVFRKYTNMSPTSFRQQRIPPIVL